MNKDKVPEKLCGFCLIESRFVKEVNAPCHYFIHEQSGARLFKIAADDPNKLFNISFRTYPPDDSGIPHILEHSVLNGSRKFPVKSPFDVLLKGSLNTFLNAMTSADHTDYPVASMNHTDYFNLMDVYLDAVFYPAMLNDNRILRQEGWHHELSSPDSPLTIRGVVYNEMKGTFSSPHYLIYHLINKYLFPDNLYGKSSAGHPDHIPSLTDEAFIAFHRKYYQPSNSFILLYGDAELEKELEFLDSNYLSAFNRTEELPEVEVQKPFKEMLKIIEPYPVPYGSETDHNTYLTVSFVTEGKTDRMTAMALELMLNALVNHESAPLRLALQEASIGKDITGWFSESGQNTITIIVSNANEEDLPRFSEIFKATLEKVIATGFDPQITEGILNRTEFHLKEGDTPHKGLMYLEMISEDWLFGGNPFIGLEYESPLRELRLQVADSLLENLVRRYLTNNPHSLQLTLVPDPELQSRRDKQQTMALENLKTSLTEEEQISLIRETEKLIEYQEQEDSEEALATIPVLKLSDIPGESQFWEVNEIKADQFRIYHHDQFTNGIVYTSFYFDLSSLPQEDIPYAALLPALLGKLDTENLSYSQLDNQLNIHTGGFVTNLATFLRQRSDDQMIAKMVVSSKSTLAKTGKMVELLGEIILRTRIDNRERLKTLIKRHQAKVESNVRQNGMNYALARANSHFSNRGMFNEQTSGIEYYRFITQIVKQSDDQLDALILKLQQTVSRIFTNSNLHVHVTCPEKDTEAFNRLLRDSLTGIPEGNISQNKWNFSLDLKNEAILSSSQVQYVVKSYDFKKLGYLWSGSMTVLNQILSTDWLQNQIRVKGGAYGGFSGITPGGLVYFASYRDPNLRETLKVFDLTPDYIRKFSASEAVMTRYIIGAIAGTDQPKTPSQKGAAAMHGYFEEISREQLNADRSKILCTSPEDIRKMAPMISDVLSQNNFCVYGNETIISENASLFDDLIRITADE